ncbi:MAG: NAD-dependent malic enzyme [Burkholderiales bacterium]|nr:NAD-dependent malic enzyme [Burkholderiales bacterium]
MTNMQLAPGAPMLRDPLVNRGTGFTAAERELFALRGLLPPRVESIAEQAARVVENVRAKASPIEKHLYLAALQNENETLFYRVVLDHLAEMLPLVYTPTVGEACLEWSRRYSAPRGLYVTPEDRGRVAEVLRHWPRRDVAIIVVTDGGRILGLGDLGANGMGIPVGKLALYTACAGVPPERCLPVTLDVGTDNAALRDDPFYIGRRAPRLNDGPYEVLVGEFLAATQEVFPGVVVQFEDFANANAFRLLAQYRERLCCFNDDVQGTGAMGLAGLMAAGRISGRSLADERVLFVGAGEACLGMGAALTAALRGEGLAEAEAKSRCLFVDSTGTVVTGRADLPAHKRAFAQDRAAFPDLVATIEGFRPTALVGACGQGGRFTEPVIRAMARVAERPVVFALSNPTSKSECTAEQAYAWSEGRAIFASGSPFAPVTLGARTHAPGQANNAYIFPGVGLGLLVSGACRVTDAMFLAAARALAGMVTGDDLALGRVFPPQDRLREVATAVAAAVARVAFDTGLARRPRPADLDAAIRAAMYRPEYA